VPSMSCCAPTATGSSTSLVSWARASGVVPAEWRRTD